ncbi:MAG: L-histidine N(alpha)-methyltransferase [Pseudomonadota bacterium]
MTPSTPGWPARQLQLEFAAALRRCLAQQPHVISPKFFYDAAGSALFDRICALPEYYPTRTEITLLQAHAPAMAEQIGAGVELIEFGAGSLVKVRLLLQALRRGGLAPVRFLPVDISAEHLLAQCQHLRDDLPGLQVEPLVADFTRPLPLPPRAAWRRVGYFPGSSIGNFMPEEALGFLAGCAELLRGGGLLIGIDLVKDPALLHAAYNDAQGVTAAFNLNLLQRARRELGCDIDPAGFWHHALYNPLLARIEMHLVSRREQTVRLQGESYQLAAGDTLHTENSYKYTVAGFQALARQAGFAPGACWLDENEWFCVMWLQAPG